MHLRSKLLAVLSAGAVIVAALTATAESASAGEIHPMGGCFAHLVCGTIANGTSDYVKVCKDWHGSGPEWQYQPEGDGLCAESDYASPHSAYGQPQWVDIDAFYIPSGTSYDGFYIGGARLGTEHMEWTHTQSGWWKFSDLTTVHIDWIG